MAKPKTENPSVSSLLVIAIILAVTLFFISGTSVVFAAETSTASTAQTPAATSAVNSIYMSCANSNTYPPGCNPNPSGSSGDVPIMLSAGTATYCTITKLPPLFEQYYQTASSAVSNCNTLNPNETNADTWTAASNAMANLLVVYITMNTEITGWPSASASVTNGINSKIAYCNNLSGTSAVSAYNACEADVTAANQCFGSIKGAVSTVAVSMAERSKRVTTLQNQFSNNCHSPSTTVPTIPTQPSGLTKKNLGILGVGLIGVTISGLQAISATGTVTVQPIINTVTTAAPSATISSTYAAEITAIETQIAASSAQRTATVVNFLAKYAPEQLGFLSSEEATALLPNVAAGSGAAIGAGSTAGATLILSIMLGPLMDCKGSLSTCAIKPSNGGGA